MLHTKKYHFENTTYIAGASSRKFVENYNDSNVYYQERNTIFTFDYY